FVESQSAPVSIARELDFCKLTYGFFRNIPSSAIISFLKVHLKDFGQIVGCSKKPGITRNPAHHCCSFVVYKTANGFFSEKIVGLGGYNPADWKVEVWFVAYRTGSQRTVKIFTEVIFVRPTCHLRNHSREKMKPQIGIQILLLRKQ